MLAVALKSKKRKLRSSATGVPTGAQATELRKHLASAEPAAPANTSRQPNPNPVPATLQTLFVICLKTTKYYIEPNNNLRKSGICCLFVDDLLQLYNMPIVTTILMK